MKKIVAIILLSICLATVGAAQTEKTKNENELKAVLTTFMECLIKKDREKFYGLFHDGSVVWVGIYKSKSHQQRVQKNSAIKDDYFTGDYKGFYEKISEKGFNEEKFYNIDIQEDGYVASITFDYSFWANGKKQNWGKESWGLVKANGKWKITSVIFSMELEEVQKEPSRQLKK